MLRIEDELKNNQISRFQLLYGEERYMVQYYRNQLIEKLSNPDDEMNRTFLINRSHPRLPRRLRFFHFLLKID